MKGKADDLIGFLESPANSKLSVSRLYQYSSAIAFFYRLNGQPSPTNDPLVSMYLKGRLRKEKEKGKTCKRAKPMTQAILRKLNRYVYDQTPSLRVWRTVWRVNVAFYGLLRWDDLRRLKVHLIWESPKREQLQTPPLHSRFPTSNRRAQMTTATTCSASAEGKPS
jgi:hypothetical protein